jgi:hypothetical protein
LPQHPPVFDILAFRFGFVAPRGQTQPSIHPTSKDEWDRAMMLVGHRGTVCPDGLVADTVVVFMEGLVKMMRSVNQSLSQRTSSGSNISIRGTERVGNLGRYPERRSNPISSRSPALALNYSTIPNELWDLHPQNPRRAAIIARLMGARRISVPCSRPNVPTEEQFVFPPGPNDEWILSLLTATDLIHACRLGASTSHEIASQLIKLGIPFRTYRRLDRDWCPRKHFGTRDLAFIPLEIEIPFRSMDYHFTASDYSIYEHHRDNLLNQPHARSLALKFGGIIWRLSRDTCFDWEALLGPSRSSTVYGFGTIFEDGSGSLCEDTLSNKELDIICGLHSVLTGTLSCSFTVLCLC